jgi:hypothetical protein
MPADDGGPIDKPISKLPTTSAMDSGTALSNAPSTPNARPTWRLRIEPRRRSSGMPSSSATTEPPVIIDER